MDIESAIEVDFNLIGSVVSDYARITVNDAPDIVFKSSPIPDIHGIPFFSIFDYDRDGVTEF